MILSSLLVLTSLSVSPTSLSGPSPSPPPAPAASIALGSTNFCDPAAVNSSGNSAVLTSMPIATGAGYRLLVSGGPTSNNSLGYFIMSGSIAGPIPLGDGNLCLGGTVGRYSPNSGANLNSLGIFNSLGVFTNPSGTSATGFGFDIPTELPPLIGGLIAPGSTWHFQLWFRDSGLGPTTNLSNGLSLTF